MQNRVRQEHIFHQKAAEAMLLRAEAALPYAKVMLLRPKSITIKKQKHNFSELKVYLFTSLFRAFLERKLAPWNLSTWLLVLCQKHARITIFTAHPHLLAKIARKRHYEKSHCHANLNFAYINFFWGGGGKDLFFLFAEEKNICIRLRDTGM